jgi:hypothetical protein
MTRYSDSHKTPLKPSIPFPGPPSAKILYHYTTGFGFEQIIEKGVLWATHASFMNDAEEYIDNQCSEAQR